LWTYQLPGPIRSGMAIANGSLYTSTGESSDWHMDTAVKGKTYGLYAFSLDGQ